MLDYFIENNYFNLINSKTSKKTKDKRLKTKGSKHYEKQS